MKNLLTVALAILWSGNLLGQVSYQRILNADDEPGNWLTYSRTYNSQRYSHLDQIRRDNVNNLELKWVFQAKSLENFEATPLVVDGVMYLTRPPNVVVALDARTGRVFWTYHHKVPKEVSVCCGLVNRGLAILDNLLFLGTLDARLQAIDAKTGSLDPELNLLYWGIGNPGPDWNGDVRKGDNLYCDSVVALNPDNGRLQWHFQFTPHDLSLIHI